MARVATSSPIQIPGLHKSSWQKPFFEDPSPNRCAITDRHKGGRGMVRAYVDQNYHPDVCKDDCCANKFKQIKTAYEHAMNAAISPSGRYMDEFNYDSSLTSYEGLMGVYDDSWEDWEEWMGWEGAGTRDYTTHINIHL